MSNIEGITRRAIETGDWQIPAGVVVGIGDQLPSRVPEISDEEWRAIAKKPGVTAMKSMVATEED